MGFYSLITALPDGQHSRLPGRTKMRYPGVGQGGHLARFDGGKQGFIWTPFELNEPGVITLGEDPSDLVSAAARALLRDRLAGRAVGRVTVERLVRMTMLDPPRRGDELAWNGLRSRKDGRLHLRLGPSGTFMINDMVAARGPNSQDIVDTFDRANGNVHGSTSSDTQFTWSGLSGASAHAQILSNALRLSTPTGGEFHVLRASLAMDTLDHYAEINLDSVTFVSGSAVCGPVICIGTGEEEGYSVEIGRMGGSASRVLKDFSTDAELDADTTLTTSGLLRVTRDGDDLSVTVGGTEILAASDASSPYTGHKGVGVVGYVDSSSNFLFLNNFRGADVVVGGGGGGGQAVRTMHVMRMQG